MNPRNVLSSQIPKLAKSLTLGENLCPSLPGSQFVRLPCKSIHETKLSTQFHAPPTMASMRFMRVYAWNHMVFGMEPYDPTENLGQKL